MTGQGDVEAGEAGKRVRAVGAVPREERVPSNRSDVRTRVMGCAGIEAAVGVL